MSIMTYIFGAGNYGGSIEEELRPQAKKVSLWSKLLNLFRHG